jgi:acyl-CoA thioester hydrolase
MSKPFYEIKMTVPFFDLDPMQIVWHGNYFKYFEIARNGLFEKLNIRLYDLYHDGKYAFPIVRTFTKYIHPLRFNDEFVCKAAIGSVDVKIETDFDIRLVRDNTLCVKGKTEQAALRLPEMELMMRIPAEIRRALGEP